MQSVMYCYRNISFSSQNILRRRHNDHLGILGTLSFHPLSAGRLQYNHFIKVHTYFHTYIP